MLPTRLRQHKDGARSLEIEPEFLLASTLLVHIERLPDVVVLAKRSFAMSDSFEAWFTVNGWRFYLGTSFAGLTLAPEDPATPGEIFDALRRHIEDYRAVMPPQLAWCILRYFFLPATPPRSAHKPPQE